MVSGDLLVEARRRAGISQAELGRRSGVPPSLIGRYERYEVTPSLERLRSLIRAAGFELSIRLARLDPSNHDQVLIERELRRTPAERLRRGLMAGRKLGALAARPRRVRA
jgi:uncharacterized protein